MKFKINGTEILSNQVYTSDIFSEKKPNITSTKKNNTSLYTTIIVDPDAPYPSNPTAKYFIHLLVVNSQDIKIEYYPPNPPADSPPHRYQVLLYSQPNYIQIQKSKPGSNFDLNGFVNEWNLELVDSFEFRVKKS